MAKICIICEIKYEKPASQPFSWWATSKYCSQGCYHKRKVSEETREKMSLRKLGNKNGLGYRHNKVTRQRMSDFQKSRWNKPETYRRNFRADRKYREWRNEILKRDNFLCSVCRLPERSWRLEMHHMKAFKDFPELRFEASNVVVMCHWCHKDTDNYGARRNKKIYGAS